MGAFFHQTLNPDDSKEKIVTFDYIKSQNFYKAKDIIIK